MLDVEHGPPFANKMVKMGSVAGLILILHLVSRWCFVIDSSDVSSYKSSL